MTSAHQPSLLAELLPPASPAVDAAREVAQAYHSPSLVHHCERSYLWGAHHGIVTGLSFDRELLAVAALLHDLGLTDAFDNVSAPFEAAGGDVAWVFAGAAGWPAPRRERLKAIIVEHMWNDPPARSASPEGHLLHVATSFDISGHAPELFPADLRAAVLAAYPRLDLADEFIAAFEGQARRKPGCAAAISVGNGIATRMGRHPLEPA